jgi:tuberous sclerosis protein 2
MIPLLSTTLFFIADHLTDADTAKLPSMMFEQHDLSPASPDWLKSWEDILSNPTLFAPTRALTRLEIMKALRSVYDSLKDMHSYRKSLADLVFYFCRMQADNPQEDLTFDSSVAWRILGDEVVLRAVEAHTASASVASSSEPDASTLFAPVQELIGLLTAVAVEGGVQEDEDDTGYASTSGTPASPAFPSSNTSSVVTPMLSRKQSEHRGGNARDRDSNMPSVLSILSSLAGSRSQSQHSQEHESPSPALVASPASEPILPRAAVAVVSLVSIFSQLAFTPHALLQHNVILAGQVFDTLVKLIGQAKSPRTRLTVLQFTMRIRADRDHRLYFVDAHYDPDSNIMTLASLIGRIQGPSLFGQAQQSEDERTSSSDLNNDDSHVRKPQPRSTQERDGRRASRGRGIRPNQSAGSRSRSRASLPTPSPSANQTKTWDTLWQFPESLPFTSTDPDNPSEGIFSYDPIFESIGVLRVDSYLSAIFDVLEKERNWEILSYVLCHLPVQLANKHLFCGPKCRETIVRLLTSLCSGLASGGLASSIDRWPLGLKPRDAHGLAFHTLTVLISYSRRFDLPLRHAIVDVLREGLDSQPTTIICCLQALTLCAFELLSSLKRSLPSILEKLSQIMSNPDMAVHILSFLSIVGSIPALHANLREEDFKMVFGVALQYLQHHNRPCATPAMSWAMSQYVRMISFSVVYVWFLAVKLPHRPRHISYITRQLLLANEGKDDIDEPTEVCFDWLARYAYASADPRPAHSTLSEIVMNPNNLTSPEPAVSEKTWLSGNSVITIRSLARLGWIEVLSRRPSGLTRFLCKLENIPLVGPGDVDPDMVSVAAGMMMERDVLRPERPDAGVDQSLETNPRSVSRNFHPQTNRLIHSRTRSKPLL